MFPKERQKATRAHKRLQKRLDASSSSPNRSERSQLEKDVHDAQIDLHYTIYHPLTEKYRSIFPRQENADSGGGGTAARKLVREKPAMWHVVERCAAEGTLEALREGKLAAGIPIGRTTPAPLEKAGAKCEGRNGGLVESKAAKRAKSLERDGDSDGGFFEE